MSSVDDATAIASLPHADLAATWAERRGPRAVIHADSAAAGRTSIATRARIAEHLDLEAAIGGYVAQARVEDELAAARENLGLLLGFSGGDVAFHESASTAFAQLLGSWRLEPGDTVWAVRSEWGPNLAAFEDLRLHVELLDTDDDGVLDVEALARRLRGARPAMVHLDGYTSHRALAQPVAAAAAVCHPAEVPVVVDTAQALGQIAVEPGAAAVYGTGRKWLCGPRGVGYLAVRDPWQARLQPVTPALAVGSWPVGGDRPIGRLGSREAFHAGRLGLGVAVAEHLELGPERIRERIHATAVALRTALAEVPGWKLRDAVDAPGAIVVVEPEREGLDVPSVHAELLRRGVLGTAAPVLRAPHDMTGDALRFSPHADLSSQDVGDIARELADISRG